MPIMETDAAFIAIKTTSGRPVSMSVSLLIAAINSSSIDRNSKLTQISYVYMRITVPRAQKPENQPGNAKRRRRQRRRRNRGETGLIDTLISSNCGIIARHFLPTFRPALRQSCPSFHPLSHL